MDGEPQKACRCKKNGCLKLYCVCFAEGISCGPSCTCHVCRNVEGTVAREQAVVRKIAQRPDAFERRVQDGVHVKGCACKKGCRMNYCECRLHNVACSTRCRCRGCTNTGCGYHHQRDGGMKKRTRRKKTTRQKRPPPLCLAHAPAAAIKTKEETPKEAAIKRRKRAATHTETSRVATPKSFLSGTSTPPPPIVLEMHMDNVDVLTNSSSFSTLEQAAELEFQHFVNADDP